MIYLDNAATTLRKPPCVIDAVVRAMTTLGNSGRSAHEESLTASRIIYDAREAAAALFGCPRADHVAFTANSTEALNIAIGGLFSPGDHVISTDCEHNSVLRPLYRLEGADLSFVPAARPGPGRSGGFAAPLRPHPRGPGCPPAANLSGNPPDIARNGRPAP